MDMPTTALALTVASSLILGVVGAVADFRYRRDRKALEGLLTKRNSVRNHWLILEAKPDAQSEKDEGVAK